ncbi:MAG: SpoIIE family protein phosphatase [Bacteroidia bacterium]|nr:SpoIIE family protein phosphatase [Bacteroidia bacterium]
MNSVKKWFIGDYLAKTDDVFERSKIELLYNYCVAFFLIGMVYYIHIVVAGLYYHAASEGLAMVSLLAIPFVLKYTRNVKLAAWIYIIQQTFVSFCSIIIENGEQNLISGFWISLFILFSFFLFDIKLGAVLIGLMAVTGSVAGALAPIINVPVDQHLPMTPDVILLPLSLVIFVTYMFLKTRKQADKQIREQKEQIENKNKEVTDSINYAQRIQKAILPSHRLVESYLPKSFVVYLPKDIVSGDFYWVEKKGNKVFFAVADCTGHGVPGAMMSVIGQNAINRVINEFGITKPSEILDKLTVLVEEAFSKSGSDVRDGMDICLCSLDTTTNKLEYSGANNPVYIYSGNELKEIKATKQPIGRFESKINFVNHEVQLNLGDAVYLFTDGIADQFGGPEGKKYKYKRVKELLLQNNSKSHSEQKNNIITEFVKWKGQNEQIDDVCLMGIKI